MSSSPIDTPAMIAALKKTWLKTKTTKTAAAFIDALQADLDEANAAIAAVRDDDDQRANIELKVALHAAESERDAALATVAQLVADLKAERLTHNNMSMALREATAGSALPPSDIPPPTIADHFYAMAERQGCISDVQNFKESISPTTWGNMTKADIVTYLPMRIVTKLLARPIPPIVAKP